MIQEELQKERERVGNLVKVGIHPYPKNYVTDVRVNVIRTLNQKNFEIAIEARPCDEENSQKINLRFGNKKEYERFIENLNSMVEESLKDE